MPMLPRVLLALLLLGTLRVDAQAPAATDLPPTPQTADAQPPLKVKLGRGAVGLSGPWKFHTGDNIAWAAENFDDSAWGTVDLTPPPGTDDTEQGTTGFIPGWTAQGYPNYSGYAWYRRRVELERTDSPLAIKMPDSVDDAYQLYVNGQLIGEFGKFTPKGVTAYSALPRAFALPKNLRSGPVTIAVRMWMDSATPFNSPDAGGMHGTPFLGYAGAIATQVQMDRDVVTHHIGSGFLEMLILVITTIIALGLYWLDETEPAYLWLALVCVVTILGNGLVLAVNVSTWMGQVQEVILSDVVLAPLRIGVWVLFWGYWFRIARRAWLHRAVWGLVLLMMLGTAMLRPPLYGQTVPVHAATTLFPVLLVLKLGLLVLLLLVTVWGIRKQKTEGWLALATVVLVGVSLYQRELRLLHIRTGFALFGFRLSMGTVSTIFSLFLITVMLLRRYLHAQQRRDQWKAEIEQARQVQHVLLPEKSASIPGLSIESEYRPAQEVGGDFFQVLPGKDDSGVLVVVGDVTGKGLQAGMLVALIVGALRTAAQFHSDPLALMNILNERLCGRGKASATCLILRIARNGEVTLVNAGHLPPYLNGKEMQMEGALPIGVLPDPEFCVMSFTLAPGDTLMLMSDGVAEAQNEDRVLFGFERISKMLERPISAAALASAAQAFGQEDDILVLRIERQAVGEPLLAERAAAFS